MVFGWTGLPDGADAGFTWRAPNSLPTAVLDIADFAFAAQCDRADGSTPDTGFAEAIGWQLPGIPELADAGFAWRAPNSLPAAANMPDFAFAVQCDRADGSTPVPGFAEAIGWLLTGLPDVAAAGFA